jgi:uncharacterized protein (DUF362 family)/Pyruvate/2-oxoacid:ferredoxin oxidoreductase delta subunit
MNSPVSLSLCRDYEDDRVADAVSKCLEGIGSLESLFPQGRKVLVKPNLLSPRPPEEGVTTHPSIVRAVINLAREKGCVVSIGDSHGGYERKTGEVWEKTGMKKVSEDTGAPLVNFEAAGAVLRRIKGKDYAISKVVLESDLIINLPRMKTHIVTTLTNGVKNMFGCVPGFRKATYHRDLHSVSGMSNMLVDVCQITAPHLTLMDAVVSMDGNGPAGGRLRDTGFIAASRSPYALDVGVANLISVGEKRIPTVSVAGERGLGPRGFTDLQFVGDDPGACRVKDFKLPIGGELPPLLSAVVGRAMWVRPRVDPSKCTACEDCVKNCPVSAIEMHGGLPRIDLKRCISCFCCQEMCRSDALIPFRSRHLRLIQR